MIHIVICDNKTKELDKIISGERKILLRGSASRKIPHSRIYVNDELYFVEKGSNVSYYHADVLDTEFYSRLTNEEINNIFDKYKDNLALDEVEEKKWKKKSITVIKFKELKKIEGLDIPQYTALEDWIMVNDLSELNS